MSQFGGAASFVGCIQRPIATQLLYCPLFRKAPSNAADRCVLSTPEKTRACGWILSGRSHPRINCVSGTNFFKEAMAATCDKTSNVSTRLNRGVQVQLLLAWQLQQGQETLGTPIMGSLWRPDRLIYVWTSWCPRPPKKTVFKLCMGPIRETSFCLHLPFFSPCLFVRCSFCMHMTLSHSHTDTHTHTNMHTHTHTHTHYFGGIPMLCWLLEELSWPPKLWHKTCMRCVYVCA